MTTTIDLLSFKPTLSADSSPKNNHFVEEPHQKEEEHTTSICISNDSGAAAQDSAKNRKKYSVIGQDAREKLVDLVLKKKMRIKEAAKICNLKFSTSKAILATYRKEGRVGKKKTRARKTKVINTLIVAEVNPFDPSQTKIIPMMSVSETKLLPNQATTDGAPILLDKAANDIKKRIGSTTLGQSSAEGLLPQASTELKSMEVSESMKQMLEITAFSSKMHLLNDIQGMISKINCGSNTQNMPMMYLQNALQNLNTQFKSSLDNLLMKRKMGASPLPAAPAPVPAMPTPTIQSMNVGKPRFIPTQMTFGQSHQGQPMTGFTRPAMPVAPNHGFLPHQASLPFPPFRMNV